MAGEIISAIAALLPALSPPPVRVEASGRCPATAWSEVEGAEAFVEQSAAVVQAGHLIGGSAVDAAPAPALTACATSSFVAARSHPVPPGSLRGEGDPPPPTSAAFES